LKGPLPSANPIYCGQACVASLVRATGLSLATAGAPVFPRRGDGGVVTACPTAPPSTGGRVAGSQVGVADPADVLSAPRPARSGAASRCAPLASRAAAWR